MPALHGVHPGGPPDTVAFTTCPASHVASAAVVWTFAARSRTRAFAALSEDLQEVTVRVILGQAPHLMQAKLHSCGTSCVSSSRGQPCRVPRATEEGVSDRRYLTSPKRTVLKLFRMEGYPEAGPEG